MFSQELIDILLFPDVGRAILHGKMGRKKGSGCSRGVLGAVVLCFTQIYLSQMDSLTGWSQYQDVIYAIVFTSSPRDATF